MARVSEYFSKNPNLKKKKSEGGGGREEAGLEGGSGTRVSELFLQRIQI